MPRYVKYKLTGKDERNGCNSPLSPGIVWPNILALPGLQLIMSVGYGHQEEYFEIEESEYSGHVDYLSMYGNVEEVSKEQISKVISSFPLP